MTPKNSDLAFQCSLCLLFYVYFVYVLCGFYVLLRSNE